MLYLRELSKQRIANIGSAAREVLDQVIAGEYSLALQIFNHHTVISAKKGAPVDWIKMEPVTGTLSVISVHKSAPHPNAAKLLVDFITSSEGQNIFRDAEYLPADPTVPALTPSLKPDAGSARISSRRSRPRTTWWPGRRSTMTCSAEVSVYRSELW